MLKRNIVLALVLLAAVLKSIHLILELRWKSMENDELPNYLVENQCPVCEETHGVVPGSVPASVPHNTNARHPSGNQRTPSPSSAHVPNENYLYSEKTNRNFSMEKPEFLQYLCKEILVSPLPMPYKLDDPFGDPTLLEGQNKVILNLLKNKVAFLMAPAVGKSHG